MVKVRRFLFSVFALAALTACKAPSAVQTPRLPSGVLATIGPLSVTESLLAQLDGAPSIAWQALQHDLLFSLHAGDRVPGALAVIRRGLLGRQLLESLSQGPAVAGEPTEEEIRAVRQELWLELDRPRALSTVDAFVPVPRLAPDSEAFAFAERLHGAVAQSKTLQEFAERANAVDPTASRFRIVRRPPTTEDGRVAPLGPLDSQLEPLPPELGKFIARLQVGEVSRVAGGPDGFHVFFCTAEQPPLRPSEEESREMIRAVVRARRLQPEWSALLVRLRQEKAVQVVPHHASLTRLVWQERE